MTNIDEPAWAAWFADKDFSRDFTSNRLSFYSEALEPYRAGVKSVLEIGAFEGRSAVFWAEFFAAANLTIIDPWPGRTHEMRFDSNMTHYPGRVRKLKGFSYSRLPALVDEGCKYDFIHIDGSHRRDDVILDSFLCWRLLADEGVVLWDDYKWKSHLPDEEIPKGAIDYFLACYKDQLTIIHRGYQVIARKNAAVPA